MWSCRLQSRVDPVRAQRRGWRGGAGALAGVREKIPDEPPDVVERPGAARAARPGAALNTTRTWDLGVGAGALLHLGITRHSFCRNSRRFNGTNWVAS